MRRLNALFALAAAGLVALLLLPTPSVRSAPQPIDYGHSTGRQTVLLIRFNFPDNQTTFDTGAITSAVSDYYKAQSFGAIGFVFRTTSWLTIAAPSTPCDLTTWKNQAVAAGGTVTKRWYAYDRVFWLSPASACGSSVQFGWDNISESYLNGGAGFDETILANALGRNLGIPLPWSNQCSGDNHAFMCLVTHDDPYSLRGGASFPMHFDAMEKGNLGWIGYAHQPVIQTIPPAGGTFQLGSYETGVGGPVALFWRSPTTGYGWWIESRAGIGLIVYTGGRVNLPCTDPLFLDWDTPNCGRRSGDSILEDLDPTAGVDYILDPGQDYMIEGGAVCFEGLPNSAVFVEMP